jgi:hypothetical protein
MCPSTETDRRVSLTRLGGVWLPLLLLCGACDDPALPSTALLVTVTFANNPQIDELSITGVAMAQNRAFGPFDSRGSSVVSGCTISLLFDPGDAGSAKVCVEGRAAGTAVASACGMFQIQANAMGTGAIDLQSGSTNPNPPPTPTACQNLDNCCHRISNNAVYASCESIVQMGNADSCTSELNQLKLGGYCND